MLLNQLSTDNKLRLNMFNYFAFGVALSNIPPMSFDNRSRMKLSDLENLSLVSRKMRACVFASARGHYLQCRILSAPPVGWPWWPCIGIANLICVNRYQLNLSQYSIVPDFSINFADEVDLVAGPLKSLYVSCKKVKNMTIINEMPNLRYLYLKARNVNRQRQRLIAAEDCIDLENLPTNLLELHLENIRVNNALTHTLKHLTEIVIVYTCTCKEYYPVDLSYIPDTVKEISLAMCEITWGEDIPCLTELKIIKCKIAEDSPPLPTLNSHTTLRLVFAHELMF